MDTGMDAGKIKALPGFTILEVSVVVAILGVIVTIITVTLNRFNEQLKVNTDIQKELANWMLVRSNFWNEYYLSDSILVKNNELFLFQSHRVISYKSDDEQLMRKEKMSGMLSTEWVGMNVVAASIVDDSLNNQIILTFPLKGEDMELRFPKQQSKASVVNNYYEKLLNE